MAAVRLFVVGCARLWRT